MNVSRRVQYVIINTRIRLVGGNVFSNDTCAADIRRHISLSVKLFSTETMVSMLERYALVTLDRSF